MKLGHVCYVMINKRSSNLVLLAAVVATISIFSFLPKDAFADHFCSHDDSVCIIGHVENADANAIVGKPFSVTYIVDNIEGDGFINFNFQGLKSEDGQYYLINHNKGSFSFQVGGSTGRYISPVSASFIATKEGQYKIELDISADKNSASEIASKQYFTVKTTHAVPEFPATLTLLALSISALIAFYRIKILK